MTEPTDNQKRECLLKRGWLQAFTTGWPPTPLVKGSREPNPKDWSDPVSGNWYTLDAAYEQARRNEG